jgi:hypothetical protein
MAATTTKASTPKAKATNGAGVTKGRGRPAGVKGGKKANARNAMAAMQAYCE